MSLTLSPEELREDAVWDAGDCAGHTGTYRPRHREAHAENSGMDYSIWNTTDCVRYLNVSRSVFAARLRYERDFPAPLLWSVGARPKWSAQAVKDWVPAAGSRGSVLYRHFAADGELLYVGISISHIRRLAAHSQRTPWFQQIIRIELAHFATIAQARLAEREAIKSERPRFNVAHRMRA